MRTIKRNGSTFLLNRSSFDFSIMLTSSKVLTLNLATHELTPLTIYWGDGLFNTYTIGGYQTFTHTYTALGTYNIVIEGNVALIRTFSLPQLGVGSLGRKFFQMSRLKSLLIINNNKINAGYEYVRSTELEEFDITNNGANVDIGAIVNYSQANFKKLLVSGNTISNDALLTRAINPLLAELQLQTDKKIVVDFTNKQITALTNIKLVLTNTESVIGVLNFATCTAPNNISIWYVPSGVNNAIVVDGVDLTKCYAFDIYGTSSVKCPVSINLNGVSLPASPPTATFHSGPNSGAFGDVTNLFPNLIKAQKVTLGQTPNLTGDISSWRFDRNYNAVESSWYNSSIAGTNIGGDISNLRLPYSGIRLNLSNNKFTGVNNFVNALFEDRLLISNGITTAINVAGNKEAVIGVYQQGSMGSYTGSIHDLTEAQITVIAASWSTLEKIWWLVNAKINNTSTTKRYKYSFTV